nr:hypothetical protein [Tanacetum cinerariifolium]
MRQRRWLELLKDYDTNIQYHPRKANVLVDALSRKSGMIAGIKGTRLVIPNIDALRETLLTEAHSSSFSVHPGSTKMYHDLKQHFWWSGMKGDVATFVSKCLICPQVKIEHQRASGLLQPLDIPDQVRERVIEGPEMIKVTNKKVTVAKEKLKEARTRQKSYADKHRRSLEFQPEGTSNILFMSFHIHSIRSVQIYLTSKNLRKPLRKPRSLSGLLILISFHDL